MLPSRVMSRQATCAIRSSPSAITTRTLLLSRVAWRQLHISSSTRTLPALSNTRRWNSSSSATASAATPPSATTSTEIEAPDYLNDKELHIFNKLKGELQPSKLEVQDVSGGCGSMYALDIVSAKFKGLSVIKQHRLVNAVLKDEIKGWHGVQLKTKAP